MLVIRFLYLFIVCFNFWIVDCYWRGSDDWDVLRIFLFYVRWLEIRNLINVWWVENKGKGVVILGRGVDLGGFVVEVLGGVVKVVWVVVGRVWDWCVGVGI